MKFTGNPELKKWHKLGEGILGFTQVTETPEKIILHFDNKGDIADKPMVTFIKEKVGELPGVTYDPPTKIEISKQPKEWAEKAWSRLFNKKIELQIENLPSGDKGFKPKP